MSMKNFVKEEKAQAALEYVMLVGGAVVAAITIGSIYIRMVRSAGEKMISATAAYSEKVSVKINEEIAKWTKGF